MNKLSAERPACTVRRSIFLRTPATPSMVLPCSVAVFTARHDVYGGLGLCPCGVDRGVHIIRTAK